MRKAKEKVVVGIQIPATWKREIEKYAKERGKKLSEVMRDSIYCMLERIRKKQKEK